MSEESGDCFVKHIGKTFQIKFSLKVILFDRYGITGELLMSGEQQQCYSPVTASFSTEFPMLFSILVMMNKTLMRESI